MPDPSSFPRQAVGFLGKYLDLPNLLKIDHPSGEKPEAGQTLEWSSYDICEGWAVKRGFMTKRAARPDEARAANHLLRLSLEGRICLYLRPPNYTTEKAKWESHPDVKEITKIQALGTQSVDDSWTETATHESEDDEDESHSEEDEEEEEKSEDEIPAVNANKFALLGDSDWQKVVWKQIVLLCYWCIRIYSVAFLVIDCKLSLRSRSFILKDGC